MVAQLARALTRSTQVSGMHAEKCSEIAMTERCLRCAALWVYAPEYPLAGAPMRGLTLMAIFTWSYCLELGLIYTVCLTAVHRHA